MMVAHDEIAQMGDRNVYKIGPLWCFCFHGEKTNSTSTIPSTSTSTTITIFILFQIARGRRPDLTLTLIQARAPTQHGFAARFEKLGKDVRTTSNIEIYLALFQVWLVGRVHCKCYWMHTRTYTRGAGQ